MADEPNRVVMIIEDETPLLLAIQKKLEHSGFETITARDGKQALDYLMNLKELPSLIWLDYYLPSMSGLEFLTEIKKHPRLAKIPVFVVSNTASPDKVETMMELGAHKYFLKAEKRLEEIIDEINKFIDGGEDEQSTHH